MGETFRSIVTLPVAEWTTYNAVRITLLFQSSLLFGVVMTLHIELIPLLALVAGILILIKPRLLQYIVAIYLIAYGVIEILGIRLS